MKRLDKILSPLLCLLPAVLSPAAGQTGSDSLPVSGADIIIQVSTTQKPVTVDGRLDEPAWRDAVPYLDYFFQQEPLDRAPSSQKTELRVLQDGAYIYFGAICYEQDPSQIFATVKRRDGSFLSDDAFELLIDTFQDKRNSFAFGTNPFGAKIDAIISDEGNHINKSWDCIWYCKTSVDERGWIIEIAVPFKSLKYKHGETVDWGLNITREIKHSKEVTYLAPIPRGLGHNGKFKGSLFATLRGIRPPESALNLEVQPYLTSGRSWLYETDQRDNELGSGFDIRYKFTPQLNFDFSYQTDFAQAEADEEIANLTRFNINLKEKREFFLESAGIFNFGGGQSAGGTLVGARRGESYKLFESRTIGIHDGRKVPMWGGAKLAGRAGRYSLGVMNMQSKHAILDDTTTVPSTNFTVARLKRDFLTNSYVGMLLLNKQSNPDLYSRTVGADYFLAFTPEVIFNGSLARSFVPAGGGNHWAGETRFIVNKEWIDFQASYTHLDSLFDPEMGFIQRGNIRSYDAILALTKWLNNGVLRSLSAVKDIEYKTDHHNTLVRRENRYNFYATLASEDKLFFSVHKLHEYLPFDDEIREIPIAAGGYTGYHKHVRFNSYRGRKFSGSLSYRWGALLDGTTTSLSVTNQTKISNSFNIDLTYKREELDLSQGSVTANVIGGRFIYSFTTELFAKYYVQWNDADRHFSSNLLVDYIFRPRCHFYFVFNDNRDRNLLTRNHLRDRQVLLKLTYLWNV
ncbi:MAG: carbohydrate binding family 9 domain-containing protein [Candidatus Glassbacteria bacterium]|nr:carbohydrate binding family 9 domain-containing protein [Candidatus Glassbacteria bacterium]